MAQSDTWRSWEEKTKLQGDILVTIDADHRACVMKLHTAYVDSATAEQTPGMIRSLSVPLLQPRMGA